MIKDFHFELLKRKERQGKPLRVMLRIGSKRMSLGVSIPEKYWDKERETVLENRIAKRHLNNWKLYDDYFRKLRNKILGYLEDNPDMTAKELFEKLANQNEDIPIVEYTQNHIYKLKKRKQFGNARSYQSFLRSFENLVENSENKTLRMIDKSLVHDYHRAMINNGLSINTRRAYLSSFRAIFNLAVENKVIRRHETSPFKGIIKKGGTSPKAIDIQALKRLRNISINKSKTPALYRSWRIFLFMFNCQGMNFIDVARLKEGIATQNQFQYTRNKLREFGEPITVYVTQEAKEIMLEFRGSGKNGFLFPILDQDVNTSELAYKKYRTKLKNFNDDLKTIGKLVDIDDLTSYVSRYSYGTIAAAIGIDLRSIQSMYGHTSIQQTESYLANTTTIDLNRLNEKITQAQT